MKPKIEVQNHDPEQPQVRFGDLELGTCFVTFSTELNRLALFYKYDYSLARNFENWGIPEAIKTRTLVRTPKYLHIDIEW